MEAVQNSSFVFLFFIFVTRRSRYMQIISNISCIFYTTGIGMSHFCDPEYFLLLLRDATSFPERNLSSVRSIYRNFLRLVNAFANIAIMKCTAFIVSEICKADFTCRAWTMHDKTITYFAIRIYDGFICI